MEYQYITNKTGEPIAVVIPIPEWEAIQSKLKEECLTEDAIREAEQGWKDYLTGKGEPLENVKYELLVQADD